MLPNRSGRLFNRYPLYDILFFLVFVGAGLFLLKRGASRLEYYWQWYQVPRYIYEIKEGRLIFGPLLQGLGVTVRITLVSLVLSFIIGLITALLRASGSFVAAGCARIYLETVRNTPLLVQLFFFYFALGPILGIGRFETAVLALSIFEGAYASEIIRAGILSIPKGQYEAAHSLGLGKYAVYRCVVLPQAIRNVLPPLTGQAVSLVKDSALVSVIAVYEMTMQANAVIAETFLTFEIYFTIAGIYLLMNLIVSIAGRFLESRYKGYA